MAAPLTCDVNTNFQLPSTFQIVFDRLPDLIIMATAVKIPGITLTVVEMPTLLRPLPIPGSQLEHGSLDFSFILNEGLGNWYGIYSWLKALGRGDTLQSYGVLEDSEQGLTSDVRVLMLGNAGRKIGEFEFTDAFPTSLSDIPLTTQQTEPEPIVINASFEFTTFTLKL